MNNRPLVSIIIPTFKRTSTLKRAINSAVTQTYDNLEIIVIDDNFNNSLLNEKIVEIINGFSDERIRYIRNSSNLGGALARNEGIFSAVGEYITFLDDDDIYLAEKVERQINFMLENDLDMSIADIAIFNKNDKFIGYREHSELKDFSKKGLLKYHMMRHLTGTATLMYKKAPLLKIGGFDDIPMGQEFVLVLKSIEADLKIGYLPECHVHAYRLSDGISTSPHKIQGERNMFAIKLKYRYLFSKEEFRFIKFRHRAVMSAAFWRNKKAFKALYMGFLTVLTSPGDFLKEGSNYLVRVLKRDN